MEERFIYLMFKKLNGNATVNELNEIDKLIATEPDLKEEVLELETIWAQSAQIENSVALNKDESWRKFEVKLNVKKRKKRLFVRTLQIAASILIVVGMGFWFNQEKEVYEPELFAYSNTDSKAMKMYLPDSSVVHLNKGAVLSYSSNFNDELRELDLIGEAFFEVRANVKKPFIVNAEQLRVKVLGTSFSVSQNQVAVKSGKVQVSNVKTEQSVHLVKNQRVRIEPSVDSMIVSEVLALNQFAHFTQRLKFESTMMKDIVIDLQKVYHIPIIINNPDIRELSLTITLKCDSVEQALNTLNMLLDFDYEQKRDTLFLN